MARLTDALLTGAYNKDANTLPMLDLKYGGQQGWSPNLTEWVSNQAYVTRPVVCILLEAPKMFTVMPDADKWVSSLKSLFEVHARTIDGLTSSITVDTDTHPVGGGGEEQDEVTDVKREKTQPKFTFVEKYGRPVQNLLDFWIRYGLMDPETKFALLGTMNNASVTDLLADWYSATCLFMEPDPIHKKVNKAWITTNMFPKGTGDINGKRDLTSAQEILTLDVDFTGITQTGIGVVSFAQQILDNINITNADPFMKPGFIDKISADVSAQATVGYKNWAEQVGKTAVTHM